MDYSKFTVVQLKQLLAQRGLKRSGHKAELIDRLLAYDRQLLFQFDPSSSVFIQPEPRVIIEVNPSDVRIGDTLYTTHTQSFRSGRTQIASQPRKIIDIRRARGGGLLLVDSNYHYIPPGTKIYK